MKILLKKIYSYVNNVTTKFFFYVVSSFHSILVFLNTAWVYFIFFSLFVLILAKLFMGFVLGSYLVGKCILILGFLKSCSPFINCVFRDFRIKLFSWLEFFTFLIFSIQVVLISGATIYDVINFFSYHRHGVPCHYFGECADRAIENALIIAYNFFLSSF